MSKRDWLKHLGFATATAIAATKSSQKISDEEYKQLELLLDKLEAEVGDKFSIIPRYIHDGYHMAVYSKETGMRLKQRTGPSIKETVELLKQATDDTVNG